MVIKQICVWLIVRGCWQSSAKFLRGYWQPSAKFLIAKLRIPKLLNHTAHSGLSSRPYSVTGRGREESGKLLLGII
jgi:hypothetical protein